MAPLRIAILDCDPLSPVIRKMFLSYGGLVTTWLNAGAKYLNEDRRKIDISIWDVMDEIKYPSINDIDAVVITGSRFSAYDDVPWVHRLIDFIKTLLEQERGPRVAGLCFGHQIAARAIGVDVIKNERDWEVSVSTVDLSPRAKDLFGKEKLEIHQMHKDIVRSYPDGVEALGSSPTCEVQGMYIANKLITLQGHPEFSEGVMSELLKARHAVGIFDDRTFEDAMQRAGKSHDGVLVASAFLEFMASDS